jgi:hypothetical protein
MSEINYLPQFIRQWQQLGSPGDNNALSQWIDDKITETPDNLFKLLDIPFSKWGLEKLINPKIASAIQKLDRSQLSPQHKQLVEDFESKGQNQ